MPKIDEIVAEEEAKEEIPFDEIFSGPAVFANKTYVTVVPIGVRFTFMEGTPDGQERFRTAAYLTIMDAVALRDVLNQQLERVGISIKEMTKEEAAEHFAQQTSREAEEK